MCIRDSDKTPEAEKMGQEELQKSPGESRDNDSSLSALVKQSLRAAYSARRQLCTLLLRIFKSKFCFG